MSDRASKVGVIRWTTLRFIAACIVLFGATFTILAISGMAPASADAGVAVTPLTAPGGQTGLISSVSCPTSGSCVAAGFYGAQQGEGGQPFATTLSAGTWSAAVPLPVPADISTFGAISIGSISCTSTQNCVVVGSYLGPQSYREGFADTETSGTWGVVSTGNGPLCCYWRGSGTELSNSTAGDGDPIREHVDDVPHLVAKRFRQLHPVCGYLVCD